MSPKFASINATMIDQLLGTVASPRSINDAVSILMLSYRHYPIILAHYNIEMIIPCPCCNANDNALKQIKQKLEISAYFFICPYLSVCLVISGNLQCNESIMKE